MKMAIYIALATAALLTTACTTATTGTEGESSQAVTAAAPQFDADSAYSYVAAQCAFGPRVPATEAHAQCATYLTQSLNKWADSVIVQEAPVTTFDGKRLTAKNIIAQINPTAEGRILLVAHWDCRPWADQDPDPAKHKEPVMGANDAASGVGVLMEIARQLKATPSQVGVDILLVDVEDWGNTDDEDSWALGTQYWAKHPHVADYKPLYGILLDMVGARGAQFAPEYYSAQNAPDVVQLVWGVARSSGYSSFFKSEGGGGVTDDHVAINQAGIPCIDIIDMRMDGEHGFFDGWHTTHDTMDNIDRATLKAVGQTLLNLIYQ